MGVWGRPDVRKNVWVLKLVQDDGREDGQVRASLRTVGQDDGREGEHHKGWFVFLPPIYDNSHITLMKTQSGRQYRFVIALACMLTMGFAATAAADSATSPHYM